MCKIYRKATSLKELELRAAKEEEKSTNASYPTSPLSSSNETQSFIDNSQLQAFFPPISTNNMIFPTLKKEENYVEPTNFNTMPQTIASNTIQTPFGKESLQLQVPKSGMSTGMEWGQDPLFSLSCTSPWLENLLNLSSPSLISQIF